MRYFLGETYLFSYTVFLALIASVVVMRADDDLLYSTTSGSVAVTLTIPPNVIAMTVEVVG